MSEKIIRTPEQIPGATLECLLLSYNALTGHPIKRFADRVTAERRLEMAMLAAQDATGHAGVPKGHGRIIPKTAAELGVTPEPDADCDCDPEPQTPCHCSPDWPGMVQSLSNVALATPAPEPTLTRTPHGSGVRFVRATGAGKSKLQTASVRNAVMQAVLSCGEHGVALADLDTKFPPSARGHVQKLLASGHVEGF